jgi:hypothetical protein
MVQNETRGFSFRRNSKKMARVKIWGGFSIHNQQTFRPKMSRAEDLYKLHCIEKSVYELHCLKNGFRPAIAAVEVSRSTRSHPIENVRQLFYSKSTTLNIVESLIIFFRSLFVANERNLDLVVHMWLRCSPNSTFGGAAGGLGVARGRMNTMARGR